MSSGKSPAFGREVHPISIRAAQVNDIPILADYQCKMAMETENVILDKDTVVSGLQAMFYDPSKGKYFVAEYDGAIAACHSITYEWSDWRNGTVWWIQSVYVAEPFRKVGIFKAMYDHLKLLAQSDPTIRGIRLYVDKSNLKAQQVYQSIGMNGEHYSVFEWMKR